MSLCCGAMLTAAATNNPFECYTGVLELRHQNMFPNAEFHFHTRALLHQESFDHVNDWLSEVNRYASEGTSKLLIGEGCEACTTQPPFCGYVDIFGNAAGCNSEHRTQHWDF